MAANVAIDAALLEMALQMAEQLDGKELLIGESRMADVAEALNFQD